MVGGAEGLIWLGALSWVEVLRVLRACERPLGVRAARYGWVRSVIVTLFKRVA